MPFNVGADHRELLKAEEERTGVCRSEILRNLITTHLANPDRESRMT